MHFAGRFCLRKDRELFNVTLVSGKVGGSWTLSVLLGNFGVCACLSCRRLCYVLVCSRIYCPLGRGEHQCVFLCSSLAQWHLRSSA